MLHRMTGTLTVSRIASLTLVLMLSVSRSGVAAEDIEIHEWGVWFADANHDRVNQRDRYASAMPGTVESTRSVRATQGRQDLRPLNILTLYGDPVETIDVEIQLSSGRVIAHWPKAEARSRRLRWFEMSLNEQPAENRSELYVREDHWFRQARAVDALYINHGARTERFLAYDPELEYTIPIELEGGPDSYQIVNTGEYRIFDVMISAPSPNGRRVGWLDSLAGKAQNATESDKSSEEDDSDSAGAGEEQADRDPMSAKQQSAELAADSRGVINMSPSQTLSGPLARSEPAQALTERLTRVQLSEQEANLIVSQYADALFRDDELVVVYRLDPEQIESLLRMELFPEPARTVRVVLVVVSNLDPGIEKEIFALIEQLGETKFAKRETAEKRLLELGRKAVPQLTEALKSKDLEVVFRAERVLLALGETLPGQP